MRKHSLDSADRSLLHIPRARSGRQQNIIASTRVPYNTIPYHTIPYHTIPYHTIPYHTVRRESTRQAHPPRCIVPLTPTSSQTETPPLNPRNPPLQVPPLRRRCPSRPRPGTRQRTARPAWPRRPPSCRASEPLGGGGRGRRVSCSGLCQLVRASWLYIYIYLYKYVCF